MSANNHVARIIVNMLIMVACSLPAVQAYAQGRSWQENILQKVCGRVRIIADSQSCTINKAPVPIIENTKRLETPTLNLEY